MTSWLRTWAIELDRLALSHGNTTHQLEDLGVITDLWKIQVSLFLKWECIIFFLPVQHPFLWKTNPSLFYKNLTQFKDQSLDLCRGPSKGFLSLCKSDIQGPLGHMKRSCLRTTPSSDEKWKEKRLKSLYTLTLSHAWSQVHPLEFRVRQIKLPIFILFKFGFWNLQRVAQNKWILSFTMLLMTRKWKKKERIQIEERVLKTSYVLLFENIVMRSGNVLNKNNIHKKRIIHFIPYNFQDLDPPILQEGRRRRQDKLLW